MIRIGIISVLVGIVLLFLSYAPYLKVPIWFSYPLFSNLGSILIGAGLVELLIQLFAVKDLTEKVTLEILNKLHLSLEAFYENRGPLPRLSEVLTNVSEVWFAFHTGTVLQAGGLRGIVNLVKKVRIIVMNPDSVVDQQVKMFDLSKDTVQHGIRDLVREAQERGVDIKLHDGPIGNSILIVNPCSESGWAQVECLVPCVGADDRPSFRVSLKKGKRAFQTILSAYKQLWKESEQPPREGIGKQSLPSKHE